MIMFAMGFHWTNGQLLQTKGNFEKSVTRVRNSHHSETDSFLCSYALNRRNTTTTLLKLAQQPEKVINLNNKITNNCLHFVQYPFPLSTENVYC